MQLIKVLLLAIGGFSIGFMVRAMTESDHKCINEEYKEAFLILADSVVNSHEHCFTIGQ